MLMTIVAFKIFYHFRLGVLASILVDIKGDRCLRGQTTSRNHVNVAKITFYVKVIADAIELYYVLVVSIGLVRVFVIPHFCRFFQTFHTHGTDLPFKMYRTDLHTNNQSL